jgi:hypothetical protein
MEGEKLEVVFEMLQREQSALFLNIQPYASDINALSLFDREREAVDHNQISDLQKIRGTR